MQPAALLIVGGVFIFAGAAKLLDPAQFAYSISRYRLVPSPLAVAFALWLPWLELLGGACVFFPRFRRGALAILLTLGVAFLAALVSAWVRHLDIGCGCFGDDAATHAPLEYAIGRDLLLIGLAAWLLWREFFPGGHAGDAEPGGDGGPPGKTTA